MPCRSMASRAFAYRASAAARMVSSACVKAPGAGNLAIAVLGDHRQRALRQIAQIVGEVGIDAVDDRLVAVAAVLAEGRLAQEEVAHLIGAIAVHEIERVDDVADRLRHLLPAVVEEAVREHAMRQSDARRHQERRPIDRVKAQDILADDVHVRGPVAPARARSRRESRPP